MGRRAGARDDRVGVLGARAVRDEKDVGAGARIDSEGPEGRDGQESQDGLDGRKGRESLDGRESWDGQVSKPGGPGRPGSTPANAWMRDWHFVRRHPLRASLSSMEPTSCA